MNKISAKIVADSISPKGKRITTMELIMPRYILAEFNTHRALSRNSASSRAIPFKKMVKMVQEEPFIPIAWQKDHSGMQGNEYFNECGGFEDGWNFGKEWLRARDKAVESATFMNGNGLTKQLCNRILEPFMYHKVLVTATEWENFFNLRCPQYELLYEQIPMFFKSRKGLIKFVKKVEAEEFKNSYDNLTDLEWLQCNKGMGEIHIMDLAEKMYDVLNESTPTLLKEGEWHIPYGDNFDLNEINSLIEKEVGENPNNLFNLNEIQNEYKSKIATARCARLSYQTLGDNPVIDYAADIKLFDILFKSGHYSPFEHVSRCMNNTNSYANFKGFKQYRTILEEQL